MRIQLSLEMICRHKILVAACVICLAEGAAQPLEGRSDSDRLQTVAVHRAYQEFPEPHPPTDEAGVLFHKPPIVSSAVTSSAGFLQEDSDGGIMNLLRPSLRSTHTILQPSYYSEEIPVWEASPVPANAAPTSRSAK